LTGRDVHYLNPAVSVRSYVVAHALDDELVELDGQLLESLSECESFTRDPQILTRVDEMLFSQTRELTASINFNPYTKQLYRVEVRELQELLVRATLARNAAASKSDPSLAASYQQALFDLQDKIKLVRDQLAVVMKTPPAPEAA